MKKLFPVLLIALVWAFGSCTVFAITADEVLQGVENRNIGKTSQSETIMKLINTDGNERNRTMNIYRRKIDNDNKDNFIHFLAPTDIKDTTYLVNEKSRERLKWIYLSAMKKIRKIQADDYAAAFVSSDFAYEDMDDIHASDYECSNLVEEKLDGEDVYSIDVKKKDGKTSYSKTTMKVSKEKMLPLKSLMFDKNDPTKQVKELTSGDLEKIQDIWTPKTVTMKDLVKGTSTVLAIKNIKYDVSLEDSVFTESNMQK
ncbi:MAG: outer membrane lipoprotein-sorting protein [Candidatus Riflebacteria bacterium]|nr:outer membrane lipoprotein-sorting protein [Candidatus Riflebacteria bacterium]